ncbi:MAG TPA: alpha/beta fold hydrolase [Actinomycetota bacterium]
MSRRAALVSAGLAAGAIAAGALGRTVYRRRHADARRWSDVDPPEDLGRVPSFDGTHLAVRAAGDPDAPVVLLAHGFSLDATVWSALWPELVHDLRVVTFDLRSHGRSDAAAHGDLGLRAVGRDLGAVLDAVAPDAPAVVVGHSMGAIAILALAEQRPELFGPRIAGAVFLGAAASDLLRGAMGSIAELLRPRLGSVGEAARRVDRLRRAVLRGPADVSAAVARLTQFGPDAPPNVVDHVVALAERARPEVWTDGLAALMSVDLRHAVPRVRVPALVVVGEHDRVTPPASAVALAGELPEGRLVVLEGAGHIPMLERPEALADLIRPFARRALGLDAAEGAA